MVEREVSANEKVVTTGREDHGASETSAETFLGWVRGEKGSGIKMVGASRIGCAFESWGGIVLLHLLSPDIPSSTIFHLIRYQSSSLQHPTAQNSATWHGRLHYRFRPGETGSGLPACPR